MRLGLQEGKVYEAEKREEKTHDGILNAEKLQLFTGLSTRGSLAGFVFSHSALNKSHPQPP